MSPRKKPKESPPSTGEDLIGALPDEILHHVLSFLPAQEAVRTCLLARRWRHLWKSATGRRIGDEASSLESVKVQQEFIDHLLLLRGSAPLDTCVLRFIGYDREDVEDTVRLNRWFRHALLHKVRFLELYVWDEQEFSFTIRIDELPLVSRHLTRLELFGIMLNDSFLNFSSCPKLELLVFESCLFNRGKISSNSAKRLSITDSYFSEVLRVRIDIPSLISLRLDRLIGPYPVLERMPSLVDAFVRGIAMYNGLCGEFDSGDCGSEGCESCCDIKNNCVLLEGISEAKTLTLTNEGRTFIFKRDLKWCPTFTNLKTLVLDQYRCAPDGSHMLPCILEHSPVLEKLIFQLYFLGFEHTTTSKMKGIFNPMERSAGISEHLQIVEVRCNVFDHREGPDARNLFDEMSPRKKPKELPRSTGEDRIGALPDEVLHHVLSFLPSQEAVRTCLLARRWRNLWKLATGLRIGEVASNLGSVKEQQAFIYHLLLLRDSNAPLDTCILRFNGYDKNGIEDKARLNLWFRYALLRNVRFLQLEVWDDDNHYEHFMIDDLPLISQHLTKLQLYGIIINGRFLNFSSCPALEHLEFDSCVLKCAKVSSNSVKHLSITYSSFSNRTLRACIDIPSLVSLRLDYICEIMPILERMPSLVDAFVRALNSSIDLYGECDSGDCGRKGCGSRYGITNNNCVLLEGLSEAKSLTLTSEYRSFIFKRDLKWCPTFSKLKVLLVDEGWCVPDESHMLACILGHSPVLETLIIQFSYQEFEYTNKIKGFFNPMERSAGISEHLHIVEVQYKVVDDGVLEVLKGDADARNLFDGMSPRKKPKESPGSTGEDRIGDLPDEVLHHVLSLLPAQQAVRTCLLARRWRNLWKSATGIRIGQDESNPGRVKDQQKFIDHLLLLRDSAPLDTCLLRFKGYDKDDVEDTARLNLWFRHALRCKVRFLQLDMWEDQEEEFIDDVMIDELPLVSRHLTRLQLYEFDSCVFFECAKISSNSIKRLRITDSHFSSNSRVRIDIPSLVSLRLNFLYARTPVLERMPSLVDAFVRFLDCNKDFCSESDSGDCGHEGCESCYGIMDNNCVLLEGMSEAETLVLENKLRSEYKYASKIKGILNPMERSASISEHLQIVEVQCNVVDHSILKVLKYLSTFEICKPASRRRWRRCRTAAHCCTYEEAAGGESADARHLFDEMSTGEEGSEAALETGVDHIGALPDTVLHHVLSFLPSQDAVRTCVLARRWLHLWKSVTALRIGEGGKQNLWTVRGHQGFIDHLLLLRDSVPLETCVLRFVVYREDKDDTSRLNLWIRHALLRKVWFLQVYIKNEYNLRSCLEILPLISPHLTRLELFDVRLAGNFHDFSRCPALQHLEFDRCEFLCDKISSESVIILSITACKFNQTSRIRICVPSLVSLRLDGFCHRTPVLEWMPSLLEAFVRVSYMTLDRCLDDSGGCVNEHCKSCYGIKDGDNCVLLGGLSEAKSLTLIDEPRSFIFSRDLKWCPTFSKLKTLLLNEYWCLPDDFSALVCILDHAPLLRNLILQLYSKGPKHTMKIKGNCHPMDRSAAISRHLEIVEIRCEVVDKRVLKVLNFEEVEISEDGVGNNYQEGEDEEDDEEHFYEEQDEEEEDSDDDDDDDA
uniref:F-box domain-containing protein n=1 Tax=Leersia perrieri TaxID=77586 RepID=A0A0D9XQ57_9ORYZ